MRSWWEAAHTFGSLATGIAAVAALLLTYQSLAVTERGQASDRFGRAVDHLAADTIDLRLSGIYALERLMRDSPDDQPTVVEVLSVFIRTHAPRRPDRSGDKSAEPSTAMAVDIQAALTVLGRRAPEHDGHARIDLSHTDLRNADLYRANLTRANLEDTDLRRAYMVYAVLTDAFLYRADLRYAKLNGSDLTQAILNGADLRSTSFFGADMVDTQLECARTDTGTTLPPGVEPETRTYC